MILAQVSQTILVTLKSHYDSDCNLFIRDRIEPVDSPDQGLCGA